MIHFECPTCAAPFDVDDRLAGRAGRCKVCGGRMKIPSNGAVAAPAGAGKPRATAAVAAAAGGPRLSPVAAPAASRPMPSITAGRPTNWLEAVVTSQVGLAPISMQDVKRRPGSMAAWADEKSVAGPYKMATAPSLPAMRAAAGKPAGAVTRGYRGAMGKVQKLFRWINQSAYLVSVPFLMLLLLGLLTGSNSLMGLGATGAIVLNIGRIVAGVANLAVIPFRESPIQGVLFLIPPITFFYMYQNWHKVKQPVKRIVGPIATIALVAAAFVAEPYIRGEGKSKGSLKDQVKSGVGTLKKGMREQIGKVPNVNVNELQTLENRATDALKSLNAGDALKSLNAGGVLKSLEEQAGDPKNLLPGPASKGETSKKP